MVSCKGAHLPQDITPVWLRWYVAYPVSYRPGKGLTQARGVAVDRATINRWALTYSPRLEAAFHHRKRPVRVSWCLDETYIKIDGQWYHPYRAVKRVTRPVHRQ